MTASSSFLVFLTNDVGLDDAERVLLTSGLTRDLTRDGDTLVVRAANGAELAIGLSEEPHVAVEAEEIAEMCDTPALATCARRFEVLVDDLEASLDELNTLGEVQVLLNQLGEGWTFLSWNGSLFQP